MKNNEIRSFYAHSDNKQFKRIFYNRKRNENEINKENLLSSRIIDFYQKLYDKNVQNISFDFFYYNLAGYGYLENYGYYSITYERMNYYLVQCYGENLENIFISIASSILNKKSFLYERENHKQLKNDFKNRFEDLKYDKLIVQLEYELNKWNDYYDSVIPDKIIDKYLQYLHIFNNYKWFKTNFNKQFKYDFETKKIVIIDNPKVKKIKK